MRSKLILITLLTLVLVGCGEAKEEDPYVINYEGEPNATANDDTKWIDSEIYGAIDSSLNISEKDDFYTAVNKDWLLEQKKPTVEKDDISVLMEGNEIVKDRLINIVSDKRDPAAMDGNQVDIDNAEIEHDKELVVQFVGAAADWDARNAAGVTPLKGYIEAVQAISNIDQLSEYMVDMEGRNVSQECLLHFYTYAGVIDAQNYRCAIEPDLTYALNTPNAYIDSNFNDKQEKRLTDRLVTDILVKLGFEESSAEKILKDCYRFEGMLVDHTDLKRLSDIDNYGKGITLSKLANLAGKYPLEAVYRAYGYTAEDDLRVVDEGYIKYLNSIYNESNLELFKAYYIVHTISSNILLLDRYYYDTVMEEREKYEPKPVDDSGKGDVKETKIKDEWDLILNQYALKYLGGPLNVVYISEYCSLEEKQGIIDMINQIIKYYHEMIDSEKWLSLSAKEATHEKLDYMTVRALYPDTMDSYQDLVFDKSDTLVSMVQKIRLMESRKEAKRTNQPVDKSFWDIGTYPTTYVNAYYQPDNNAINIMAGIVAGGSLYNVDSPYEVNLARLGTVIGHEISHAFDSNGCEYDKDGYKNIWWDSDDLTIFQLRVNKLSHYYSDISPYPGARNLTGLVLAGEAIADMGGLKVALMIAKDIPDFDYDLFFRSYAELWRVSRSLGSEMAYAESDVHPLAYLRTNITLMQFDEFIDTYGIQEGDGMYCPPEKRIAVW